MRSIDLKRNQPLPWKDGDTVWAVRFTRYREMPPTRGILSAAADPMPVKPGAPPKYFVPYKPGTDGVPDWMDAMSLEDTDVADTKEEAVSCWNRLVHRKITEQAKAIRELEKKLVPSANLSAEKDEYGTLADYPVFRADMSLDWQGILDAMDNGLVPSPNCTGTPMEWKEFMGHVTAGGFTDYDGSADLMVDGFVSNNVLVSLSMASVYVCDEFLVPFERVPEVFAGHDVRILWFNK